jgi:preprotein translocase subunit SecG
MYTFLSVIHCIICLFLVLVILLQQGKGGGLSAFSGGAQQIFGGQGAGNVLTRATGISAGLVLITSIVLARMSTSRDKKLEEAIGTAAPAAATEAKRVEAKKAEPKSTPSATPTAPAAAVNPPTTPKASDSAK